MVCARFRRVLDDAHILVADDDPAMLEAVADSLEHFGARVVRAASGAELIEAVGEQGPFELVVTDISMPWMSGLQAMQSARTAGLDTPIVVMTALKGEGVPADVAKLGNDALLLRKPFALDELYAAVTTLIERRR
ncbi:MAG TPA: response regulator [Kofleriaceae bacterium]